MHLGPPKGKPPNRALDEGKKSEIAPELMGVQIDGEVLADMQGELIEGMAKLYIKRT